MHDATENCVFTFMLSDYWPTLSDLLPRLSDLLSMLSGFNPMLSDFHPMLSDLHHVERPSPNVEQSSPHVKQPYPGCQAIHSKKSPKKQKSPVPMKGTKHMLVVPPFFLPTKKSDEAQG